MRSADCYQGSFLEVKNRFDNPKVFFPRKGSELCVGRVSSFSMFSVLELISVTNYVMISNKDHVDQLNLYINSIPPRKETVCQFFSNSTPSS